MAPTDAPRGTRRETGASGVPTSSPGRCRRRTRRRLLSNGTGGVYASLARVTASKQAARGRVEGLRRPEEYRKRHPQLTRSIGIRKERTIRRRGRAC